MTSNKRRLAIVLAAVIAVAIAVLLPSTASAGQHWGAPPAGDSRGVPLSGYSTGIVWE